MYEWASWNGFSVVGNVVVRNVEETSELRFDWKMGSGSGQAGQFGVGQWYKTGQRAAA